MGPKIPIQAIPSPEIHINALSLASNTEASFLDKKLNEESIPLELLNWRAICLTGYVLVEVAHYNVHVTLVTTIIP